MAGETSKTLHPGVELIEGTYMWKAPDGTPKDIGKYHLIIVHRDTNPKLHIAVHYESFPTHIADVMKEQNALIATEGTFWNGSTTPPTPYGDVLVNGVNHRGHLHLKRYYFGVTNADCYIADWLDVIGKHPGTQQLEYGLQQSITKHNLKHALGGIVGLIRNFKPIQRKDRGHFSADNQYMFGPQHRIAFGWTPKYMKFCIVANGTREKTWTVEQTRDFFIQMLPAVKGYRISGAVMPDTGSYSLLFELITKPEAQRINKHTGPRGAAAVIYKPRDLDHQRQGTVANRLGWITFLPLSLSLTVMGLSCQRQYVFPKIAHLRLVSTDPSLLSTFEVEWSPSGQKLVVCDHSWELWKPPQIYDVAGNQWKRLPIRRLRKLFPSPPRDSFRLFRALWVTKNQLVLVVSRFHTSDAVDAAYAFVVREDGDEVRRLVITTDDAGVFLSPDRKQMAVRGVIEGHDLEFSWGRLQDRGYWQWALPGGKAENNNVALGSFIVDLSTGRIHPPMPKRYYLWEVGGLDGTELLRQVGRPIADTQYLPQAKVLAFRVPPSIKEDINASEEWDKYWEAGQFELGTSTLTMKSWSKYVVQLPKDLESFKDRPETPSRRYKITYSPEGCFIFLRHKKRNEIWALEIASGRVAPVATKLPGYPTAIWPSPDGKKIALLYGAKHIYETPKGFALGALQ